MIEFQKNGAGTINFQKNNASLSFSENVLKGDKGDPGVTPNIQIGTVETLPAESPATASMTGTPENPLLNLGIPKGKDGGAGASDFIIEITVTTDDDINYTVASCDATFEQIDAAYNANRNIVLKVAPDETNKYVLSLTYAMPGFGYVFESFYDTYFLVATIDEREGATFDMIQTSAYAVDYSNAALPNTYTVGEALDELVPKSHTHTNIGILDNLSDSNGKLQYNGSDVGLKPVKGTDYWTAADKTEIVNDTLAALPTWTGGGY